MLAFNGEFLEESGGEEIIVQTKSIVPDMVKAVINGGHYNCPKRGLNILTFVSNCRGHQIKNVL